MFRIMILYILFLCNHHSVSGIEHGDQEQQALVNRHKMYRHKYQDLNLFDLINIVIM
jgi:hypothetical protein